MTTYIAKIKRISTGEIIDQIEDTSLYVLAEYLFNVLKEHAWTGNLGATAAKLRAGQPIFHDGFEYVITRKVEVTLREPTHRGRLEQLLRDMDVDFETIEQMTGLTLLVSLEAGASFVAWFDADGSYARHKP